MTKDNFVVPITNELVPEGWKPIGYDKPKSGEWFLADVGCEAVQVCAPGGYSYKRLILEKALPPHRENNVYVEPPEGFEVTGEFRKPLAKEWFIATSGHPKQIPMDDEGAYPRVILRKIWKPLNWMKSGGSVFKFDYSPTWLYATGEVTINDGQYTCIGDTVTISPSIFPDFTPPPSNPYQIP